MDSSRRLGFIVVFIVLLLLILAGCISTPFTKSGKSYIYQIPSIRERLGLSTGKSIPEKELSRLERKAYELFSKLYQENPELAEELGRIPEFADNEISDKDLEALVNMSDYFSTIKSKYPDRFDKAFEEILNTGIKDKRKYCSPLRFLFWLAEEKKFDEESISYTSNPLEYFSLGKLISLGINRLPKKTNDLNEAVEILNSPEVINSWAYNNVAYVSGWKEIASGLKVSFLCPRLWRKKRASVILRA